MVLSAPAPHDAHGPDAWLIRLHGILRLVQKGVLVLVDRARPERLGDLVRALLPTHPQIEIHTSASALAQTEKGSLLILVPDPAHADWLNQERPVLSNRELRVILFSHEDTSAHLARRAPDFFHWISHRVECPDGHARFAVNGLRAALSARSRGVAWGGGDFDGAFTIALPGRELVRASASFGYEQMVEAARPRGKGWVAWSDVDGPFRLRRVRWASAEAGRRARSVLVEPALETPGFARVHGRLLGIGEARAALAGAGAKHPGRLSALLDLEPEAVEAAAASLRAGEDEAAVEEAARVASDPGAAVAKLAVGRGLSVGAALQARLKREHEGAVGEVESLLGKARAGKARWVAVAKASLEEGDPRASVVWAQRGLAAEPGAAEAMYAFGAALREAGRYSDAVKRLQQAVERYDAETSAPSEDYVGAVRHLGSALCSLARYDEAEAVFARALDLARHRLGEAHPLYVECLLGRSILDATQKRLKHAELGMRGAVDRAQYLDDTHARTRVLAMQMLGKLLSAHGHVAEGEHLLTTAIRRAERASGRESPLYAGCLREMGNLSLIQGARRHAEQELRASLSIYQKTLGEEHPETDEAVQDLAAALKGQGRFEESRVVAAFESSPRADRWVQLPVETIFELHQTAIQTGLVGSRAALLAGVNPAFAASLRQTTSPGEQVLSDLHDLNAAEQLIDGSVPLVTWLQNAAALAHARPGAAVFRRALHRIADSNGGSAAASSPQRADSTQVSIARLPVTSERLFGRDAELQCLDTCWRKGVHVASIVAWGGAGKSALVNHWLTALRDKGWDGAERVYGWSFYSQGTDRLSSSDEFIDAALRWFGDLDPTQGSAWDKGERLARLVRRDRSILILDGLEPLQCGPGVQEGKLNDPALEALVKELGAQNKGLCLITSRIAVADLVALGGDKVRAKHLGRLSPEAGAKLLEARGARGAVEELQASSREYDGHALALTLLGSYLEDVAEGDIGRRKEIGPLQEDERQGGHARRVMAAYERWLGKAEVAILRMIGLFDRPADEGEIGALRAKPMILGLTDALAEVGGREWNKAVAKLRRSGLLLTEEGKGLDAHPLVREYFGEQLHKKHLEAWREGHRRLYMYLKRKAKPLPETIEEMRPLYEAVVHGCLAGKNQEALDEIWWKRIHRKKEFFSIHRLGAIASEVAALSAFFDPPWERLAPGLTTSDRAVVPHHAGLGLRALGRLSEAARLMQMGLDGYIADEDWKNAAIASAHLCELHQARGRLTDALMHGQRGIEYADKCGSDSRHMINRTTLAAVLHAMGRWTEASAQFETAQQMQKQRHPASPVLNSLWGFRYCDMLLDQSQYDDVRARAAQTLEWGKTRYPLLDLGLDHLSLGRAYLLSAKHSTGDLAQATFHIQQSVEELRQSGRQDYLPLGLLARAALHTHTRSFPAAHHDLDEALSLATRSGFRLHQADAHLGYTRLALAEHDPAAARDHLAQARSLVDQTGYHRRDGELAELTAAIPA